MEVRKSYLSKTLWTNLILAVSAMFIPSVNEWVAGNPDAVVMAFTVINMGLRLVTKDKLELW